MHARMPIDPRYTSAYITAPTTAPLMDDSRTHTDCPVLYTHAEPCEPLLIHLSFTRRLLLSLEDGPDPLDCQGLLLLCEARWTITAR